jgi:hypothetical protein
VFGGVLGLLGVVVLPLDEPLPLGLDGTAPGDELLEPELLAPELPELPVLPLLPDPVSA